MTNTNTKSRAARSPKLNTNETIFLQYYYHGNGRYHTTERGSMSYKKTPFSHFIGKNPDTVSVIGRGNDAPRGGRTGDFLEVVFTDVFTAKFQPIIDAWRAAQIEQDRKEQAKRERAARNAPIQAAEWRELLTNSPERAKRYAERIASSPSNGSAAGNWRRWIKMKAAKHVATGAFNELALTAPELRDVLNEVLESQR